MHYFFYPEVGSTNSIAKSLFHEGVSTPFCVIAGHQTSGRGQYGREWCASDGGLYFSLVVSPHFFSEEFVYKSAFIVGQVLYQLTGLSSTIKRPNDVMLNGKKVGGILLEMGWKSGEDVPDYGIIGVGLNVNQRDFPDVISDRAISLFQASGHVYSMDVFIQLMAKELLHVFTRH